MLNLAHEGWVIAWFVAGVAVIYRYMQDVPATYTERHWWDPLAWFLGGLFVSLLGLPLLALAAVVNTTRFILTGKHPGEH